jgi:hypothetical protein
MAVVDDSTLKVGKLAWDNGGWSLPRHCVAPLDGKRQHGGGLGRAWRPIRIVATIEFSVQFEIFCEGFRFGNSTFSLVGSLEYRNQALARIENRSHRTENSVEFILRGTPNHPENAFHNN